MTATIATIAAVCSAAFVFVAWRLALRVNPRVRWSLDVSGSGGQVIYTVTNAATGLAREVTVTRSPELRRATHGKDGGTPRDVHPGGTVQLAHVRLIGEPDVESINVEWRQLRFLRAKWSTGV